MYLFRKACHGCRNVNDKRRLLRGYTRTSLRLVGGKNCALCGTNRRPCHALFTDGRSSAGRIVLSHQCGTSLNLFRGTADCAMSFARKDPKFAGQFIGRCLAVSNSHFASVSYCSALDLRSRVASHSPHVDRAVFGPNICIEGKRADLSGFSVGASIAKCRVVGCTVRDGCSMCGDSRYSVPLFHLKRMCLGCTRTGTRLKAVARGSVSVSIGELHSHMNVPRLGLKSTGTRPSACVGTLCPGIVPNSRLNIVLRVQHRQSVRLILRNFQCSSLVH